MIIFKLHEGNWLGKAKLQMEELSIREKEEKN